MYGRVVRVRVTPEGLCSVGHTPLSFNERASKRYLPADVLTPDGAIVVAQVFAMQMGLIRTPNSVSGVRTQNGGWLFAFCPGVHLEGGSTIPTPLYPFNIYVSPTEHCTFVGDVKLECQE